MYRREIHQPQNERQKLRENIPWQSTNSLFIEY